MDNETRERLTAELAECRAEWRRNAGLEGPAHRLDLRNRANRDRQDQLWARALELARLLR